MPHVVFAPAIQRHQPCPPQQVAAANVRAALETVFAERPQLRNYILDEQGMLRRHVTIFIDGHVVRDRPRLTDPTGPDSEVYVVQALSGG